MTSTDTAALAARSVVVDVLRHLEAEDTAGAVAAFSATTDPARGALVLGRVAQALSGCHEDRALGKQGWHSEQADAVVRADSSVLRGATACLTRSS